MGVKLEVAVTDNDIVVIDFSESVDEVALDVEETECLIDLLSKAVALVKQRN